VTTEGLVREFLSRQRRMYLGGPAEPVCALLAEDVVWHVPGANAIAGDHRGREAVLGYFARRRELAGGQLEITEHGHLVHEDVYVAIADGRAGERSWRTAGLYRVAEGRVAEAWLVPADQQAFDDAWS
jgi:ketosteroid isomerase-like protein